MKEGYPLEHMHGEPDLVLAGMRLRVLGRERPEAEDGADGNWLPTFARAQASGAMVDLDGPWLRSSDLSAFLDGLMALQDGRAASAELQSTDPGLRVVIARDGRALGLRIEMTPDHPNQLHRFDAETDDAQVARMARSIQRLLRRFPVKGGTEA